jgi:hypothetical protein
MPKYNKITFMFIVTFCIASLGCADNTANLNSNDQSIPRNYEECIKAGFPTTKSMPPQCIANGVIFRAEPQAFKKEIILEDICKDECGNGECQEIVCMGSGCPCAESSASCPEDCK